MEISDLAAAAAAAAAHVAAAGVLHVVGCLPRAPGPVPGWVE